MLLRSALDSKEETEAGFSSKSMELESKKDDLFSDRDSIRSNMTAEWEDKLGVSLHPAKICCTNTERCSERGSKVIFSSLICQIIVYNLALKNCNVHWIKFPFITLKTADALRGRGLGPPKKRITILDCIRLKSLETNVMLLLIIFS